MKLEQVGIGNIDQTDCMHPPNERRGSGKWSGKSRQRNEWNTVLLIAVGEQVEPIFAQTFYQ